MSKLIEEVVNYLSIEEAILPSLKVTDKQELQTKYEVQGAEEYGEIVNIGRGWYLDGKKVKSKKFAIQKVVKRYQYNYKRGFDLSPLEVIRREESIGL